MRSNVCRSALTALVLGLLASHAFALDLGGAKKNGTVKWSLVNAEITGEPGETVILKVKGEITEGWHTYTLKEYKAGEGPKSTKIEIGPADVATYSADAVKFEPAPHVDKITSEQFGNEIVAFEGTVVFLIPIKIAAAAKFESQKLSVKISGQVCDAQHCRDVSEQELTPTLTLKKKVNEKKGEHTWTPKPENADKEVDWILADQDRKFSVRPGELIKLNVKGMIASEWHTFATKQDPKLKFAAITSFSVEPKGAAEIVGEPIADHDPISQYDDTLHGNISIYEGAVAFEIPILIGANAKEGPFVLTLKIDSQACKDPVCKPIRATLESEIAVSGKKLSGGGIDHKPPIDQKDSLIVLLSLAAFYGLISLLTPCVFPMIPITVSFFTKRQHVSHKRAVIDALIFSLGIVLTFVGLGFFMALVLGQSTRNLAANPWMNIGIFVVFMVMAFNLLGYYELQVPSGVLNALNRKASSGNSVYSLLLMGLVFSLTSFTCTGPFVGTVMLWAVDGEWVKPLLGMTVFATVFATPFFLLALFPAMLKTLPKSGGWLNSVKVVMGLVEIAAALKFLSSADLVWHWQIITHEVFVVIWLVIGLVTVAYLLGKIRFPHDTPLKKLGAFRVAVAAIFLAASGLLVVDLAGNTKVLGVANSYVPPRPYPPSGTDDWETGMALARKAGKPVFFDFTGVTCVNCRRMEEGMFKLKEVEELLQNYVVIRLYTDIHKPDEARVKSERNIKDQLERFKVETLPFYAIISPEGKELATFPDGYTPDVEAFTAFLKSAIPVKTTAQTANQATAQN